METRDRALVSIVAFNLVVVFYQFIYNPGGQGGWGLFLGRLLTGVGLGVLAGGLVYLVTAMFRR